MRRLGYPSTSRPLFALLHPFLTPECGYVAGTGGGMGSSCRAGDRHGGLWGVGGGADKGWPPRP